MQHDGGQVDAAPILRVVDLKKHFHSKTGLSFLFASPPVRAVDGVTFDVSEGETLAIVGESGCGKTTLGRTLMRLYEPTAGRILYDGADLAGFDRRATLAFRNAMQMIFQDPHSSLDPRMTVGSILGEPFAIHGLLSRQARRERVEELLRLVELNPRFANRYPHEFSGGQRQRIGIARALALNPRIVVCDEPISALDVSIQAQIVNLLLDLQDRLGLTYVFISHDMNIVRHISTRVAVMYLGKIVELAGRESLFTGPKHPYTQALMSAVCVPDPSLGFDDDEMVVEGEPPSPLRPPSGCRFHTRCPFVFDKCHDVEPVLSEHGSGHWVACHLHHGEPSEPRESRQRPS